MSRKHAGHGRSRSASVLPSLAKKKKNGAQVELEVEEHNKDNDDNVQYEWLLAKDIDIRDVVKADFMKAARAAGAAWCEKNELLSDCEDLVKYRVPTAHSECFRKKDQNSQKRTLTAMLGDGATEEVFKMATSHY